MKKKKDWVDYLCIIIGVFIYASVIFLVFFLSYKIYHWVMSSSMPDWLKYMILR